MIVDPRFFSWWHIEQLEFSVSIKGRTLTITRTDTYADEHENEGEGWFEFWLRVYLPTEGIPDFKSTVYTYHGLLHECAPKDTTVVNFHPSVRIIQDHAFNGCTSLVRVTIPDTVTEIGDGAFYACVSLRSFQFPRDLECIGEMAFQRCTSFEGVFLPSTITHIGDRAFYGCTSLICFYVPAAIDHIGLNVVDECDQLLTTIKYERKDYLLPYGNAVNNHVVNEWLMQRHANLPFHQACSSDSITPPLGIEGCFQQHGIERATEVDDQQMTALHTLCANPRVTGGAIRSYLQLAPEAAANAQDGTGKTGLHILCSLPCQDNFIGDAIRSYLNLAPEAVNVQDSNGKTPFQYLWNSHYTFLDERNISTLMAWWYNCMP